MLISETRSVTASYWGGGTETHSSAGTFGAFEASAVGVPFGGGSMLAYQKSNITPTEITIEHHVADFYGPGGWAESTFEVNFSLWEDTRLTISGYCNLFSGFLSLTSDSLGELPIAWHGAPGNPFDVYQNYLDFDQVLGPGTYTLSSYEIPREDVRTRFELHALSVPDTGSSGLMLAIGALALGAIRGRILSPPSRQRTPSGRGRVA